MSWPNVEKALTSTHRTETGVQTGTKIPDGVELLEKFVRMARGPGSDDMVTDSPIIDAECFSTSYDTAAVLSEDVRQWFHALRGRKIAGVLVDKVHTVSSPAWIDYRNPKTNRFVASYRLEYRQTY
jgi:hypothetical protein